MVANAFLCLYVFHNSILLQVEVCRRELYRLTEKDESVDDVPEKPRKWRDHCSTILLQSVRFMNKHRNFESLVIDTF